MQFYITRQANDAGSNPPRVIAIVTDDTCVVLHSCNLLQEKGGDPYDWALTLLFNQYNFRWITTMPTPHPCRHKPCWAVMVTAPTAYRRDGPPLNIRELCRCHPFPRGITVLQWCRVNTRDNHSEPKRRLGPSPALGGSFERLPGIKRRNCGGQSTNGKLSHPAKVCPY
jgi:hypothetical protein